jgi:hypothetical protein
LFLLILPRRHTTCYLQQHLLLIIHENMSVAEDSKTTGNSTIVYNQQANREQIYRKLHDNTNGFGFFFLLFIGLAHFNCRNTVMAISRISKLPYQSYAANITTTTTRATTTTKITKRQRQQPTHLTH